MTVYVAPSPYAVRYHRSRGAPGRGWDDRTECDLLLDRLDAHEGPPTGLAPCEACWPGRGPHRDPVRDQLAHWDTLDNARPDVVRSAWRTP